MSGLTPWLGLPGSARVRVEWNAADLWVGAFWRKDDEMLCRPRDLWVCLLPCLPLHFAWEAAT